jgi:hypothetical protein
MGGLPVEIGVVVDAAEFVSPIVNGDVLSAEDRIAVSPVEAMDVRLSGTGLPIDAAGGG